MSMYVTDYNGNLQDIGPALDAWLTREDVFDDDIPETIHDDELQREIEQTPEDEVYQAEKMAGMI